MKIQYISKVILILSVLAVVGFIVTSMLISYIWHNDYKQLIKEVDELEEVGFSLRESLYEADEARRLAEEAMSYDKKLSYTKSLELRLDESTIYYNVMSRKLDNAIDMLKSSSFFRLNSDKEEYEEIRGHLYYIDSSLYELHQALVAYDRDRVNYGLVSVPEFSMLAVHELSDLLDSFVTVFLEDTFEETLLLSSILIVILCFSSFLLYRMSTNGINYILKSFELAENRIYESDQLPILRLFFKEDLNLEKKVNHIFNSYNLIRNIKEILMTSYEMNDLIDLLFLEISGLLGIDRIGVAFMDYENEKIIAEYGTANYSGMYLSPGYEVDFHNTSLTDIVETKKPMIKNDLLEDYRLSPNSTSLSLVVKEGIRSNLMVPLIAKGEVLGIVFLSSKKTNHFSEELGKLASDIILEISSCIIRAYLTKVTFTKMAAAFANLISFKDYETGDHLGRMTAYSLEIAAGLRRKYIDGYEMDKKMELEIKRYAAIHDIGKVIVPDCILKKPGKLNPKEWDIMKQHVQVGGDVLREIREGLHFFDNTFFQVAEDIIMGHHEKWDGTGYPKGLKGEDIPLVARIVALGDVFDALVSKRVYKEAFSFNKAVDIIQESSGTHFDPVLVEAFMDNLHYIKAIYDEAMSLAS